MGCSSLWSARTAARSAWASWTCRAWTSCSSWCAWRGIWRCATCLCRKASRCGRVLSGQSECGRHRWRCWSEVLVGCAGMIDLLGSRRHCRHADIRSVKARKDDNHNANGDTHVNPKAFSIDLVSWKVLRGCHSSVVLRNGTKIKIIFRQWLLLNRGSGRHGSCNSQFGTETVDGKLLERLRTEPNGW